MCKCQAVPSVVMHNQLPVVLVQYIGNTTNYIGKASGTKYGKRIQNTFFYVLEIDSKVDEELVVA